MVQDGSELIGLLQVGFPDFPYHKLSNLKNLILFGFSRKNASFETSPHMNYHNEF